MTDKAPFEIVTTTMGKLSIRDNQSGEILHNPVGPWQESQDLYVAQSRLREKLESASDTSLVLFDVGLGAAFNASAALACHKALRNKPSRGLHIVSFEHDLRLLKFCIDHVERFPELTPLKGAFIDLIEKGRAEVSEGAIWELRAGSFIDLIKEESQNPEVVFFDPYSPKINPEMWSVEVFRDLHKRSVNSSSACVLTYSVSTAIRTSLLLGGFYVGSGASSGLKVETTFAATRLDEISRPLDRAWISRWQRSTNPLPPLCPWSRLEVEKKLLEHPQFKHLI